MKKKIVSLITCLLLIAGALVITGCAGNGENSNIDRNNTLIYGSSDYTAINPALYEHGEINALIFAGLTAHDDENKVVLGLAEDWDFNKKTNTYTFKLREGLTFHDGEPLTSEDVKFTLEAILNPDNGSEIISNYTDIEAIECPDELTVKIKLSQSNVAFPDYMTIGILPKHLLEGEDLATCEFNRNPVGAGPYRLTDWDMGQSITMESFENYYGGEPDIEKVIFKIVPDTDARAMQLKAGEIDMAQITAKTAASPTCVCPKLNPELANILSYAIDREAIVDSVLLGEGESAYSPLQAGDYNNEDIEKFQYDPEKCMSLLEAAGWQKGTDGYYEKDGQQLAFVISAMADDKVRVDMAVMCAAQLQKVGANVTAETRPSLDWGGQYACIIGWGSPFDPDDHTYKVFSTDAGDNYTGYSNSKVDELLADARHTEDKSKRRALYDEFQQAITEAMPYTFIAYVDADYAIKANIKGITENTVLGHHGVGVFHNIAEWTIENE